MDDKKLELLLLNYLKVRDKKMLIDINKYLIDNYCSKNYLNECEPEYCSFRYTNDCKYIAMLHLINELYQINIVKEIGANNE